MEFDDKGGLINRDFRSAVRPRTKGRYTGGYKQALRDKQIRAPSPWQKFGPPPPAPAKSGKIICTRLNALGLLDDAVYKLDSLFGDYLLINDPLVLIGYHSWATPIVNAMHGKSKRSRLLIKFMRFITLPVANEIANRALGKRGGFFIRHSLDVGLSACRFVGKRIENGRNKCSSASFQ
tara:strand:+ start:212 stop:748 length:537 start_codon:yes stop_codon:yes gene_type:complete